MSDRMTKLAAAFLFIFCVFLISPATAADNEAEMSKLIESHVLQAFGEKTNWDSPVATFDRVEMFDMYDNNAKVIGVQANIYVNMNDNLTVAMTRETGLRNMWDLFKAIYADERLSDVNQADIIATMMFRDKQGNKSASKAMQARISRATAKSIDWGGTNVADYEQVFRKVGNLFIHQAIR